MKKVTKKLSLTKYSNHNIHQTPSELKLIKLLDNMTKGSRDKTKQKSEKRHETRGV